MSADALKRLQLVVPWWEAEQWHLDFADALARRMSERDAALTVYGIFGSAVLRYACGARGEFPGAQYLELVDMHKRRRAEPYLPVLASMLGTAVHLSAKQPLRAVQEQEDFSRECRARIDRLKIKNTNRGVQL